MKLDRLEQLLETMPPGDIRAQFGEDLESNPKCEALLKTFENLDDQFALLKAFEAAPVFHPPRRSTFFRTSIWALPLAAVVVLGLLFGSGLLSDRMQTIAESSASELVQVGGQFNEAPVPPGLAAEDAAESEAPLEKVSAEEVAPVKGKSERSPDASGEDALGMVPVASKEDALGRADLDQQPSSMGQVSELKSRQERMTSASQPNQDAAPSSAPLLGEALQKKQADPGPKEGDFNRSRSSRSFDAQKDEVAEKAEVKRRQEKPGQQPQSLEAIVVPAPQEPARAQPAVQPPVEIQSSAFDPGIVEEELSEFNEMTMLRDAGVAPAGKDSINHWLHKLRRAADHQVDWKTLFISKPDIQFQKMAPNRKLTPAEFGAIWTQHSLKLQRDKAQIRITQSGQSNLVEWQIDGKSGRTASWLLHIELTNSGLCKSLIVEDSM